MCSLFDMKVPVNSFLVAFEKSGGHMCDKSAIFEQDASGQGTNIHGNLMLFFLN